MEANAIQQEILLVKNCSLCHRMLFENEGLKKMQQPDYDEQLEAACWNGWLNVTMPEIIDTSAGGKNLFLWKITQAKCFLNMELCEYPLQPDIHYSINPYAVLTTACYE